MAEYSEREVIASRFWNEIAAIRKRNSADEIELIRFVLLCLYAAWESFSPSLRRPHHSWAAADSSRLDSALRALSNRGLDRLEADFPELDELSKAVFEPLALTRPVESLLPARIKHEVAASVARWASSSEAFPLPYVYDFVFKRAMKAARRGVVPYQLASLIAELGGTKQASVADLFTESGDVFVALKNLGFDLSATAIAESPRPSSPSEAEFNARLRLNGVPRPRTFPASDAGRTQYDVVIADSTRPSQPMDVSALKGHGELNASTSGPVSARFLLSSDTLFSIGLVSVRQSELDTPLAREIARDILQSNRILAVVELPHSKAAHSSLRKLLWVILGRAQRSNSEKVLMVDANALHGLESPGSTVDVLSVVGRLIELQLSPDRMFTSAKESPISPLNALFDKYFWSGYRDVPGLCRLVSKSEIQDRPSPILPSSYIDKEDQQRWEIGLDDSTIIAALEDPQRRPERLYVIGNNGEGKSFMLRRISQHAVQIGRDVLAIAQGPVDRFDFKSNKKKTAKASYTYLGARTSRTGVAATATARAAVDHLIAIHHVPKRLRAFREACEQIGFSSEHFLIPVLIGARTQLAGRVVSGILNLDNMPDSSVQTAAQKKKYHLGLRRLNRGDSITPFPELSSGEQQVLLLVAKMVRHAHSGCLFLVDEPEISLHVSWQRALPKVFQIVSEIFECDVIVATHAPVIITSATAPGDRRFIIEGRIVTPLDMSKMRSIESLLFEGFKTHTPHNREVHERCASLVANVIRLVNSSDFDEGSAMKVMRELEDMTNTVNAAKIRSDDQSFERDLVLIEQAQAAVSELDRLRRHIEAAI